MAHGDTREGKWRGNWMQWVASTLHTTSEHVYPALLPLMRTPRLPVVDWTDAPRRFKWTRSFPRKTKSGFCACAITFQTQSNTECTVLTLEALLNVVVGSDTVRARLKCDGTSAETRFGLSAKRTSPFNSAGGVSSVDYCQLRCAHQR